jgi:hypothetical protein
MPGAMERYTPGEAPSVTNFMMRRTLECTELSSARFFGREPECLIVDAGSGTIAAGIAAHIAPGGQVAGSIPTPRRSNSAAGRYWITLAVRAARRRL